MRSDSGSERCFGVGEILGETALLAGSIHKVSLRAWDSGKAEVHILTRDALGLLNGEEPSMVSRIALALARRVAGRLVSAADNLQDGIWRYGVPSQVGPTPRTRTSKRRGLLTYVEHDTLGDPSVPPPEDEEPQETGGMRETPKTMRPPTWYKKLKSCL